MLRRLYRILNIPTDDIDIPPTSKLKNMDNVNCKLCLDKIEARAKKAEGKADYLEDEDVDESK